MLKSVFFCNILNIHYLCVKFLYVFIHSCKSEKGQLQLMSTHIQKNEKNTCGVLKTDKFGIMLPATWDFNKCFKKKKEIGFHHSNKGSLKCWNIVRLNIHWPVWVLWTMPAFSTRSDRDDRQMVHITLWLKRSEQETQISRLFLETSTSTKAASICQPSEILFHLLLKSQTCSELFFSVIPWHTRFLCYIFESHVRTEKWSLDNISLSI